MANNEEPYDDNDVKQLKLLMSPIWEIPEHNKSKQMLLKPGSALEQSSNAVMITDQKGIIEYVNPLFEAITGWERSEIYGKDSSLLKSGHHSDQKFQEMWDTINQGKNWQESS